MLELVIGVVLGWLLGELSALRRMVAQERRDAIRRVLEDIADLEGFVTDAGCGLAGWTVHRDKGAGLSAHLIRARLRLHVHCLGKLLEPGELQDLSQAYAALNTGEARASVKGAVAALDALRDTCMEL